MMSDVARSLACSLVRTASTVVAVAGLAAALPACVSDAEPLSARIELPPGFHAEVYAQVPNARSLAVAEDIGVVFVGTRGDSLYAIVDGDGDRRPERVVTVFDNLRVANGLAWRDDVLYVAEQHRVVRFPAPDLKTLAGAKATVLFNDLPDKSHHGWRYMDIGPDGDLYVSVGSPCNICAISGLEGTIVRLPTTGGRPRIFARGIRNSVGFDFQPGTGDLFFTDNGADWMGDDDPPEEFNHAPRAGLHFGFPYYGGGDRRTRDFGRGRAPAGAVDPAITFPAHIAPLGVHFYEGNLFPPDYRGDAFVAHHGSWNRSVPDGYRVARVRFTDGRPVAWEPFATGFLRSGRSWGRPVDVEELSDGSLLVSDDKAGVVYRITYRQP